MISPTRSKTQRSASSATALLVTAALASGCGEADADAATVVSVFDAGEGATIELPVPYEVGQSASMSATFDASIDVSGGGIDETVAFAFRLDLTATVAEVTDDGGSVVNSTIDGAEWIEQPEGIADDLIGDLVGLTYAETYDASGSPQSRELINDEGLSAEERQAAEELITQSESVAFGFPAEPVAVGATWTSEATVNSNGVEIPATYQYELVRLDDESFTIEVTYDSPVDTEVGGADVSGRISGSGTITGATDNPLELAYEFVQDATISAQQDGQAIDMQMSITFDNEITSTATITDDSTVSDTTELG